MAEIKGVITAMVTPFTADGSAIDEANLKAQVDRLVAAGIHALVPTGSTGEFASLSFDEHKRVIELYVEAAAGRVPVVAGVGALTNEATIELAKHAKQVGADALMVIPPFYEPLGFDDVKFFLTSVSDATDLPIVHIPSGSWTAPSARFGSVNSQLSSNPPGRRTRVISSATAASSRSVKCWSTVKVRMKSKRSLAAGSLASESTRSKRIAGRSIVASSTK